MNSKVIIALFCLLAVTLAATAVPGTIVVQCQNASKQCNDLSCGTAGATTDSWTVNGTGCVVADCNLLTSKTTNNACASCSSTTPVAKSDGTGCIAKSSAKLLIASAAVVLALLF